MRSDTEPNGFYYQDEMFPAWYEIRHHAHFTLVSGISPRKSGLYIRPGMCNLWWGTGFLPLLRFSNPSVILPMLHMHFINTLLSQGQTGEAQEPSKKQCPFGYRGALDRNLLSVSSGLQRLVRNSTATPRCCIPAADQCLQERCVSMFHQMVVACSDKGRSNRSQSPHRWLSCAAICYDWVNYQVEYTTYAP